MKKFYIVVSLFILALAGCGQKGIESSVAPVKINANNFSDNDWTGGVQTKEGHKNMFYFLSDSPAANPVSVGKKLIFAKSGAASVTKVDSLSQGGRVSIFVTVDHDLDPAGDGFPNQIIVQ